MDELLEYLDKDDIIVVSAIYFHLFIFVYVFITFIYPQMYYDHARMRTDAVVCLNILSQFINMGEETTSL